MWRQRAGGHEDGEVKVGGFEGVLETTGFVNRLM